MLTLKVNLIKNELISIRINQYFLLYQIKFNL